MSKTRPYRDTRLRVSDKCAHCGGAMGRKAGERITVRTREAEYKTVHTRCVFKAMK